MSCEKSPKDGTDMKKKSGQNLVANIPVAVGGVLEKAKNVRLPKVNKAPKSPKRPKPQKSTVAVRLQTASYHQSLAPENTFSYFLLSQNCSDAETAQQKIDEYIDLLHRIEIEQFSYCGQLNIAEEIRSGHFLLNAIKQLFRKEILFGKHHLSSDSDIKRMSDAVNELLKKESRKDTVDKETVLTILYDCLLMAQNVFSMQDGDELVHFHTTQIDVPFVFKTIEAKLSPHGALGKKYLAIKENISGNQKDIPNRSAQIIMDYHALEYVRAASNFVYDCVKGLGLL